MPKRRSGERDGGLTAKRRRQHLYLVVDDWLWGHSIRKVDLSSGSKSGNSAELPDAFSGERSEQQLPPPFFRLEAEPRFPEYITAAFGTKIIAMPPPKMGVPGIHPLMKCGIASVVDVRTRCFTFGPQPKVDLLCPIYFPLGDRLFVLCSDSFQVLEAHPVQEPPVGPCWAGSWRQLPKPPLELDDVSSYAVHPDGRTLFVSARWHLPSFVTYTFDTVETPFQWKRQGKWKLPFTGRAHFDWKLEAWVGLSGDLQTTGYVCACDVVSAKSDGSGGKCPSWKVSKEKLLSEDPAEKHLGAVLVYLAGRSSKFCLVQCVSVDDDCVEERKFRFTTFSLKYDKNGDLTTGNTRRVRYYKVPEETCGSSLIYPLAFWMVCCRCCLELLPQFIQCCKLLYFQMTDIQ
ncbi:uncharacterized protein LOC133890607 [Phragmites australis]|uniref:uncharacterized protein LOC133890607 n=1 Tax=Phragmites australis TaxID=29695 RepID=UPI002D77425F|nr:uncharacterized protein LOC133890607 [Phragmites australis]XP_062187047.1 uncharacterized protein LOC133890607 [Phragmites australis]XP_062187048.1 uncharacterized protein LOC133890607 [Phragmites australis]XP_062187049.1 uncharacterized protein LOC133890607 [Phragmites australis]